MCDKLWGESPSAISFYKAHIRTVKRVRKHTTRTRHTVGGASLLSITLYCQSYKLTHIHNRTSHPLTPDAQYVQFYCRQPLKHQLQTNTERITNGVCVCVCVCVSTVAACSLLSLSCRCVCVSERERE